MKILVIGYGSIGKRHARNVVALGHEVILLRHAKGEMNTTGFREYYSFLEVISREKKIDAAIVCSPTSRHLEDARMLLEHNLPFLLEKPPAIDLESTIAMQKLIRGRDFRYYDIAFNLRYFPILQFIKEFLPKLGEIYSARVSADYYLPNWRKNIDYRQTSSAKAELGGGVLLELTHEIDYILWLFGCPKNVTGHIKKISKLDISTEDYCSAIFEYENGSAVELHLSYLSQKNLRGCQIIAENGTLEWDFNNARVSYFEKGKESEEVLFKLPENYNFNDTYVEELKDFIQIINKKKETMVKIESGVKVMKVVDAIRRSSKQRCFVELERVLQ